MSHHKKKVLVELTYLARQWQSVDEPPLFSSWMASSEVDQKFLGHFAKTTSHDNPYLSSFLYKVLGLSVLLAEKLLRARKKTRSDPVRDAQLLYHILWLSREGLVMVEQYILPMVDNFVELKVLSYKLRASFYHIFVLFHNDPAVSRPSSTERHHKRSASYSLFPDPLSTGKSTGKSIRQSPTSTSPSHRRTASTTSPSRFTSTTPSTPPGLPLPNPKHSSSVNATFLLPLTNYIPTASSAFALANTLSETLLSGSHPIRLSVKVEYVAYLYDCLGQAEQSRRLAKKSIADVYADTSGMDDESFEDAAEMVGILGKMMRRGLGTSSGNKREGGGNGNGSVVKNGGVSRSKSARNREEVPLQREKSGSSSGRASGHRNGNGHVRGPSHGGRGGGYVPSSTWV